MAKVIGPCLSIEARNQLGKSMIYSVRNGKNIVRAFNVPKKVKTHAQELQRARYKNYREEWRYMETARKTIFNTRAIEQNRISGYHQFLHENLDISRKGQLYLDLSCQALWHLNEESGDVAYDGTRNHYDCTIYGATKTIGKFNGALKFDGINDYAYTVMPTSVVPKSFSMEIWIKSTGKFDADRYFFEAKGTGAFYRFGVSNTNKTFIRWRKADGGYTSYLLTNPIPRNEWVFISAVYDSSTGKLKGYKNGVLGYTTTPAGTYSNFGGRLYIGQNNTNRYYFEGAIDEVAIYNRTKTAEEIKASYDLA